MIAALSRVNPSDGSRSAILAAASTMNTITNRLRMAKMSITIAATTVLASMPNESRIPIL
jgi:hypothetical protein